MTLAFDSASPMNAAACRKSGGTAWCRYLTGKYAMTHPEVTAATGAGIGIVSIFEEGAQDALSAAFGGAIDGKKAVTAANALGQPHGTAIYATVDFDVVAGQIPNVVAYIVAFASVVKAAGFKSGCYGGTAILVAVRGKVDYLWQAAGWSHGVKVAGCAMAQDVVQINVGGVTVDVDTVLAEDYGAWNGKGKYPAPPQPAIVKLFTTLATFAKSPVTIARNVLRSKTFKPPIICVYPVNGGHALCYVDQFIWQGIPDEAEEERLLSVGAKKGNVAPSWWTAAKQEPW